MVAYNFTRQFREPIATGVKTQTIRGYRKRHARVGEPVQLYTGMQTKYCHKLIDPDPICVALRPISIGIASTHEHLITSIEVDGVPLTDDEIEEFAIRDGFGADLFDGSARRLMGNYFLGCYSWGQFHGVLIRWEPRHG